MTGVRAKRRRTLLALVVAMVLVSGVALGYWSAGSTAGGGGAAAATTVPQGATPTATATGGGSTVVVSWAARTLANGTAVSGYQVNRYATGGSTAQTMLSACTGTVTALTCTESNVPTGSWQYTVTPVFSTSWRGAESAKGTSLSTDQTPPTNSITLSNLSGGAYRSANTVYYRGSAAGSFTLTNAVADADSGPASSQTAALGGTTTGWSHAPSTVSTPAGGPYVSNPFSWTAATSSPTETVTGRDAAGNVATTALAFTNDSTDPSALVTYQDGYQPGRSVTASFSSSDAGSGLASTQLQRQSAPLSSGTCGTYGSFADIGTANPMSVYTDSTVTTGACYQYRLVATDQVGNRTFATSGNVAKVAYDGAVAADTSLLSQWRFGETSITSSDSFTDVASTVLSSHTSQDGSTWTRRAGDTGTAVVSDANRLRGSTSGTAAYYTDEVPGSADYLIEADLLVKSLVTGDYAGVVGRLDPAGTGTGTFYTARYNVSNGRWELAEIVNGSAPVVIGTAFTQTLTAGTTYRVGLDMKGSTISVLVDGIVRVSATDSSITAAGRAGVRFISTTAASNTTGLHLDNLEVSPPAVDSRGTNPGDYHKGIQLGGSGAINGSANTAATFDGANDFMQTQTTSALSTGAAARTVEVWFKTPGSAAGQARQALFNYGTNADGQEYGVWLESTGTQIKAWGGSTGADRLGMWTANFNDNRWHHFVKTYDGTTLKMYVDGVQGLSSSAARNTVVNAYTYGVGAVLDPAGGLATASFFNGSLDEMSFYSTALSQATVTDHYQLGTSATSDFTGPTGGSVTATGLTGTGARYSTSTTINLSLAKGTDVAGVATSGNALSRATGTLTNGTCGAYGSYTTVTGGSDPGATLADTVATGACYAYRYVVSDSVGNATTYASGDVKVDTTAPSAPTLAFSAFTNASATGGTVYYRPSAGNGGFTVTAAASDPTAGIASYAFPVLGAGWTSTAGTQGVNAYSWSTASPATPASPTVTATNNAGATSAVTALTVTPDGAAPSAGTVTYADTTQSSTSVSVAYTTGTDGGSGLGTRLLQRASATLTGSTCGTYGAFGTVTGGTNPASSPVTDAVTAGSCYKYQYVVADQVGNVHTATSTSVIKVSNPASYNTAVKTTSGLLNQYRLGDTGTSSDSLTDTAGTVLSAHTPELGTSWTRWSADTITAVITDANRLRKNNVAGGVGYYTGTVPNTANYRVDADVNVKSLPAATRIGVIGRWNLAGTGAGTYYLARYNTDTGAWELIKSVNGTATELGTRFVQTLAPGSTYRLALDTNGSTVRVLVDNVARITVTDTSISSAGRAGVRLGAGGDTAGPTNTTGLHLDNFQMSPEVVDAQSGNDGDYLNGVILGVVGAIANDLDTAATFDGVDDYATITRQIADDFSIELWFKSTGGRGTYPDWYDGSGLVDAEVVGSLNDFGLSLRSDGRVVAGVGNPDTSIVSTTGGYNNGAWHHVVFTRTKASGVIRLYVDGTAQGIATGNTLSLTDNPVISLGRIASGSGYYAGSLDEVALYSTVLDQATVSSHYATGK